MEVQKRQFTAALFEIGGIGAGATIRMWIETGDKGLTINPRYSSDALGINLSLNEDATIGAGGAAITPARLNRKDGDDPDFTLTKDAAVGAAGTLVIGDTTLGLQSRVNWIQEPMVLKRNTTYQIIMTNGTLGTINASCEVLFTQDA